VTVHPLTDLSVLDKYKAAPFPPSYPRTHRTFYAPTDDLHGALVFLLQATQKSLVIAMYGFDDAELATVVKTKLEDPRIFVQLTLDSSQANGVHERALLAEEHYPASLVAVGRSEKGGIMHMKECIIDGVILVTGSTNWSASGETLQDNQLTVIADPYVAAEARARIDVIHAHMMAVAKDR
jgi:phosphatidylserine/phosphatidylglycerophosphate/cardiolipin synthase-like enzyme